MNDVADKIELSVLLGVYGKLLTARQYELVKAYIDMDMSLSELAEQCGISRQAVRDGIVKAEKALRGFEQAVGAVGFRRNIAEKARKIKQGGDAVGLATEIVELSEL